MDGQPGGPPLGNRYELCWVLWRERRRVKGKTATGQSVPVPFRGRAWEKCLC